MLLYPLCAPSCKSTAALSFMFNMNVLQYTHQKWLTKMLMGLPVVGNIGTTEPFSSSGCLPWALERPPPPPAFSNF